MSTHYDNASATAFGIGTLALSVWHHAINAIADGAGPICIAFGSGAVYKLATILVERAVKRWDERKEQKQKKEGGT